MSIQNILKDCRTSMDKGVEAAKREFSSVRSGKASPAMLDTVKVEMYGQMMSMNQCLGVPWTLEEGGGGIGSGSNKNVGTGWSGVGGGGGEGSARATGASDATNTGRAGAKPATSGASAAAKISVFLLLLSALGVLLL